MGNMAFRSSGHIGAGAVVAAFAGRHRRLLSGTALTAFVAAGLFSPMSIQQARAACGFVPNTVLCTNVGTDADGITVSDPAALILQVDPGADVDDTISLTTTGVNAAANITATVGANATLTGAGGAALQFVVGSGGLLDYESQAGSTFASDGADGTIQVVGPAGAGSVVFDLRGTVTNTNATNNTGEAVFIGQGTPVGTGGITFNYLAGAASSDKGDVLVFNTSGNATISISSGVNVTAIGAGNDTSDDGIVIQNGAVANVTIGGNVEVKGKAIAIGTVGAVTSGTLANNGSLEGGGTGGSSVVAVNSTGLYTINNNANATIQQQGVTPSNGALVIQTGGVGTTVVNNYGTINGRMDFDSKGAVIFNNYSNDSWNTSGFTTFSNNDDIENNEGGTTTTTGAFAFISFLDGDDKVINQANKTGGIGTMNLTASLTTFSMGDGKDSITNKEGSVINATGSTLWSMGDGDDTFTNTGAGTIFTATNAAAATTFLFGTGEDTFSNQKGATVNLNSTANLFTFGTGVTADHFENTGGSTFNTAGLTTIMDFGDGDDDLINKGQSTYASTSVNNTFSFGNGADDFLNTGQSTFSLTNDFGIHLFDFGTKDAGVDRFANKDGSTFSTTGLLTSMTFGDGDDEMGNLTGSTFTSATLANTFSFGNGADTFANKGGSTFSLTNEFGINIFDFGTTDAGVDTFINDGSGTSFSTTGISTMMLFGDGDDKMGNRDGASYTSTALLNSFDFGAGADQFLNTNDATFNLIPAIGVNSFDFGDGIDTWTNKNGADFLANGLNTIVNLEEMTNAGLGSTMEFNGITLIGANNATGLTSLTNTENAYFEVEGLSLINFTDQANTFDNTNGAQFASFGLNVLDFGDGDDTVNNTYGGFYSSDTLGLDVGLLTFLNLETFNGDYGWTDMTDGDIWDGIIMPGATYHVDDYADHYIDAELGGLISLADIMEVESVTGNGTTWVHVNDIDDGPGEYNPYGIAIVGVGDGNADIDDFRLADGPIQKGFFSYDIYLNQGNDPFHPKCGLIGDDCFVIASVENARVFELPVLAYGANQMWNTSTGVWNDRTADLRSAFGPNGAGGGGADMVVEPVIEAPVVANSVTPGIWGRAFGATQSRDMDDQTVAPPPGLDGFDQTFENSFDQDIYGFMAGVDFGREGVNSNGENTAWIFGVLAGYTGSNLSFENTDTEVDYTAGSIGAYVTYLNGGLFVDGVIKADFGNMDYSADGESADSDYTSIGGVIDAGYRMNMASGWFIEPKATLSYVQTDFDNLDAFGQDVSFENGDSFRGRLGARVGTSMLRGNSVIEPYLEASVWNEFDGDYSASFVSGGTPFTPTFDADGVFGEVALGASVINLTNGWNGFAKGAVQFGDDEMLGFTGNLGVRKNW